VAHEARYEAEQRQSLATGKEIEDRKGENLRGYSERGLVKKAVLQQRQGQLIKKKKKKKKRMRRYSIHMLTPRPSYAIVTDSEEKMLCYVYAGGTSRRISDSTTMPNARRP